MEHLAAGDTFAGYVIEAPLGSGGMSVLYRATEPNLGRTVAIKVMASELSTDEDFRTRFGHEARQAAALDHPNVIPIFGFGEADDQLYIAMRYVVGHDLRWIIRNEGPLAPARVAGLISQAAAALDAVHRAGMVHRDVKPDNFLVSGSESGDEREHVYLADFGLTRSDSRSKLTRAGEFLGTLAYAPPEQLKNEDITPASDVYALGCVLYECLTGRRPFPRDNDAAVVYAHLGEPPPRPSELVPTLPIELDDVVASAMAKDAVNRPGSAGELAYAVRRALGMDTTELAALVAPGVGADALADDDSDSDSSEPTVARSRDHERERTPIDAPTIPPAARVSEPPTDDAAPTPMVAETPPIGTAGRNRRRDLLRAGAAVAAVVVLITAFVMLRPDTNNAVGPISMPLLTEGTVANSVSGQVALASAPASLDAGAQLSRTIAFPDDAGDQVITSVLVANQSDQPVSIDHLEVVPKALADSADKLQIGTDGVTVIENDPVLSWQTVVQPGATAELSFVAPVEAGPAEEGRLRAFDTAREEAEAAWLSAHPERTALTQSTPLANGSTGGELATGSNNLSGTTLPGLGGGGSDGGNDGGGFIGQGGGDNIIIGQGGGGGGETNVTPVVRPGAPASALVSDPIPNTNLANPYCGGTPTKITLKVSWNASIGATGYSVRATLYQALGGGPASVYNPATVVNGSSSGTSTTIDVPKANPQDSFYVVEVSARNSAGDSSWSKASVKMPNVVGTCSWTAWSILRAVGIDPTEDRTTTAPNGNQVDLVFAQGQPAGTVLQAGTIVTFRAYG